MRRQDTAEEEAGWQGGVTEATASPLGSSGFGVALQLGICIHQSVIGLRHLLEGV